jgi:phenylalanyl-tRNA synthetase beta chain
MAGPVSGLVDIVLDDPAGCPRYAAAVIRQVVVGPSPAWLARRLEALGLRPVNNLVDVTNYVMFETGQPLHAFDYQALSPTGDGRRQILVRRGRSGEEMESIDHVRRALTPDDVVITDGRRAVAVAGVMGGVDTEVSVHTRDVLIECAHFDPRRIRRSARRLGLVTESSHRFERSVDIENVPVALRRCVELIVRTQEGLAGADPQVAAGICDAYPKPRTAVSVGLRPERANALLGLHLSQSEMVGLLSGIGLAVKEQRGDTLWLEVPAYRSDLEREVDLIEEVGRLHGFDQIASELPLGAMGYRHEERVAGVASGPLLALDRSPAPASIVPSEELARLERVRDRLAHSGLLEARTYAFVAPAWLEAMGFGDEDPRRRGIELANPLSEDWRVLRTTLMPSLMSAVRENLGHREESVGLFEIAPVFQHRDNSHAMDVESAPTMVDDPSVLETETGVREDLMLAVVLHGTRPGRSRSEQVAYDAHDLKGVLEVVENELSVKLEVVNHQGQLSQLHPGVGAWLRWGGQPLGMMGQLHPRVAARFDISTPVHVLELSLRPLILATPAPVQLKALSRYPAVVRDLAFLVNQSSSWGDVAAALGSFEAGIVESVELASLQAGQFRRGAVWLSLSPIDRRREPDGRKGGGGAWTVGPTLV